MRQAAGKLTDRLHLFRTLQGIALLHFVGQIVQNTCKTSFAVDPPFRNSQPDGNGFAILVAGVQFAPDTDNPFLASLSVMRQIAIVLVSMWLWHQHLYVLADHFFRTVSQNSLCGGAETANYAMVVDDDDRLGGRIQNRAQPCFTFRKTKLDALLFRDIHK